MLKNGLSKKILCTTMVLMIVLSLCSISAFAKVLSKTITQTNTYTVTAPAEQLGNITNGMARSQISYNDGLYLGTLNAVSVTVLSAVPGSYGLTTYTIAVVYSGVVCTPDLPGTKTMTSYTTYGYGGYQAGADAQLASILRSLPQTMNYNDGAYSGTLTYTGNYTTTQTPIPNAPGVYVWNWKFEYTGTVTLYL